MILHSNSVLIAVVVSNNQLLVLRVFSYSCDHQKDLRHCSS